MSSNFEIFDTLSFIGSAGLYGSSAGLYGGSARLYASWIVCGGVGWWVGWVRFDNYV